MITTVDAGSGLAAFALPHGYGDAAAGMVRRGLRPAMASGVGCR